MPPPRRPPPFICRNCLRQLRTSRPSSAVQRPRLFSTINTPLPQQTPPAFAHLPTRRLISLSGPDAAHFLQGLTTVNVTPQTQKASNYHGFYAAFLNASGRVLHDVFIYPIAQQSGILSKSAAAIGEEGGFLIDIDTANDSAEALARHLRKFKLRAKVAIRVLDEGECAVYALWGSGGDTRYLQEEKQQEILGWAADNRAPGMGHRILIQHPDNNNNTSVNLHTIPQTLLSTTPATSVPPETYTIHRLLHGVAEGSSEITPGAALPQESNIDLMGGIDFRKGCYVGQELTIRTHHTGLVRKRILPVRLYTGAVDDDQQGQKGGKGQEKESGELVYGSSSDLARGLMRGGNISKVDTGTEKKGRSAGKWIAGVGNVGLALCRLEAMTDTVLVKGEGGLWKPGDEFDIGTEGEVEGGGERRVKVKAFIPAWHAERAEALRVR